MNMDKLQSLAHSITKAPLSELAAARSAMTPLQAAGLSVNIARHFVNSDIETALYTFADTCHLQTALANLFAGEIVNPSECRPAMHWALRAPPGGSAGAEAIRRTGQAALHYAANPGFRALKAIVHIGIGGSDFGPRLFADAFADRNKGIDLRFCANVDPVDLDMALAGLDPAHTLIIGVSKSFATEETLYNLNRARAWLDTASDRLSVVPPMIVVTARRDRAADWLQSGSSQATILDMPDSIGGRLSIWSAASIGCMIAYDPDTFVDFLAGAADMDQHVTATPPDRNLAVRLALLDVWNASFLKFSSRAVLAYSRRLRLLPAYLQQLEMESNGKTVDPQGQPAPLACAPLLWGGEGSVGQHSYHQWLHQGAHIVPSEFILVSGGGSDDKGNEALNAHALAQAELLANGRSYDQIRREEPGLSKAIAAQKVHTGGRPSTFFHIKALTPARLGALIALYEHRTYLAGQLWALNSFDQWGVERGKTLAASLKPAIRGKTAAKDPVTHQLVKLIRN